MSWLVTGGAGYIGSHVVRSMRAVGTDVVVLDDLSTGSRKRVPADVPLVVASVLDHQALRRTLRQHNVVGVVHLAGKKAVEESVSAPLRYYRENVAGVLTLLEAMAESGITRLVFSSSAAVYGTPPEDVVDGQVTETTRTRPESPYGRTKLMGEWMIEDAARAAGMSCANLRYFNVVGCAETALADTHGENLFPKAMRALVAGETPVVFGTDYPTRDGSCVRDFVHVEDLAEAHVAAARLVSSRDCVETFNIGCGRGHTVLEVLREIGEASGLDSAPRLLPRRDGDPVGLVADAAKAGNVLEWQARHGLRSMVDSAWRGVRAALGGPAELPSTPALGGTRAS